MDIVKACPDVSVIVPVYNVEEYLEECLDSLLNQGDISVEVIMIDDGSADLSGEIADAYAEKYDNFHVFHIENGGLGHARNLGVTKAHGKYIFFVDSDDIIPDNTFSEMFRIAENNRSDMTICNVARFNSKRVWASGIHQTVFEKPEYSTHISKKPELVFDTISCNKLILREFFIKHAFAFPENILYEDIPVTIPMHVLANNVSMYNGVGYLWRTRDGATKSITQNTESMKNLTDRITIMRMLDSFFKENVTDETLNLIKQTKALQIDLNIFANACSRVDREPALEMMKVINSYIDEAISAEAMSRVSIVSRQKFAYIKAYDYEGLKKLCAYETKSYYEAPVEEKDGRLILTLDNTVFTLSDRDATEEFKRYGIRQYIDETEQTKTTFIIHAHAYKRRISLSDEGDLRVRAYAYNIVTNERFSLPTRPERSERLTESFGTVTDEGTGITKTYNYDAAGVGITVDINELINAGCPDGQYKILLEYENKYYSGSSILKGAKEGTLLKEDSCLVSGDAALRVNFLYMQEICFTLTRGNVFAEEIFSDENGFGYVLNTDAEEIYAASKGERISFEKSEGNRFFCASSLLTAGNDYDIFVRQSDKVCAPLMSYDKKLRIFRFSSLLAVHTSLKTRVCSVRVCDEVVRATDFEAEGTTVSVKTSAVGKAAQRLLECDKAVILVRDAVSGKDVVLGKSKCRVSSWGNVVSSFVIDFSKKKVNKNLYESERTLFVRYFKGDEEVCDSVVYSEKNVKAGILLETLKIKLTRLRSGEVSASFKPQWKENERSVIQRKAIRLNKYPEFLKEPINPELIVFESMWGAKYSCNPRAMYEYIDKNFPEYECVWILDDERMPINGNGRRVRRFSEEYWHCLATAKYLVNNVNFPNEFVKRKGQIMVETMHGTPLKTFGLEITQEMTSQDKKDSFIRRVSAWDYLIVQGDFMKNKAFDCFRYTKKILKTGYPRTDSLFNMSDGRKAQIKKSLGLPEGKKIILYTPTWRVRNKFDMMLDLERMRERLSDEYILLIRIHYFSADGYKIPADDKFIFDVNKYSSVEELYQISDMLITDYSSVMFDYALLDKPMLFFTYDFDVYCNDLRGIYVDFKNEAPGPLVYTSDEVIGAIENIDEEMKKCEKKVRDFRNKYLTYENAASTEKVVKKVMNPTGIAHRLYMRKKNK